MNKMLRFINVLTVIFLLSAWDKSYSQVTLVQEDFEDADYTGYSLTSTNSPGGFLFGDFDGGLNNDYIRRGGAGAMNLGSIPTGFGGSNFVGIEDADGYEGTVYLTLDAVSISGYSNLEVSIKVGSTNFVSNRYEENDYLKVEYELDNSGSWILIGQFIGSVGGDSLRHDTNLDGTGDIATDSVMNNYTYNLDAITGSSVTGSSFKVRVSIYSGIQEEMVFDDIQLAGTASANTITTGTITGSPFCPGASVNVPFTSTGTFTAGNVYTAQLSDASGSFASPTSIGTLTSTANSGTVSASLPGGTSAGTGYRIRVVSSSPSTTGMDNGSDLTINSLSAITSATSDVNNVCPGAAVELTANGVTAGSGATLTWFTGTGGTGTDLGTDNPLTVNPAVTTTYYARLAGTCNTVEGSVTVTVDKTGSAITSATSDVNNVCPGAAVELTANGVTTGSGATLTWFTGAGGTGTDLGTDNPLTVNPAVSTTYYARLAGTCNTVEESVSVQVADISDTGAEYEQSITICQNSSAFNLTDSLEGNVSANARWYFSLNEVSEIYTPGTNTPGNYIYADMIGSCKDTLELIQVNEDVCTGIEKSLLHKNISVYPNPVRDILTIEQKHPYTGKMIIEMYTPAGILIENVSIPSSKDASTSIHLNDLPSGVYLLKITIDNKSEIVRIIKN